MNDNRLRLLGGRHLPENGGSSGGVGKVNIIENEYMKISDVVKCDSGPPPPASNNSATMKSRNLLKQTNNKQTKPSTAAAAEEEETQFVFFDMDES